MQSQNFIKQEQIFLLCQYELAYCGYFSCENKMVGFGFFFYCLLLLLWWVAAVLDGESYYTGTVIHPFSSAYHFGNLYPRPNELPLTLFQLVFQLHKYNYISKCLIKSFAEEAWCGQWQVEPRWSSSSLLGVTVTRHSDRHAASSVWHTPCDPNSQNI